MIPQALRALITTLFALAAIFLVTIFVTLVMGCTVIWHDDVFIGTLFKEVDANDLDMIAEPNYLQIGSGNSKSRNDKVKVIVPPYGMIETE